jgi:5-hydroxyisourate hydrolase-like protein (transthyretin family)
MSQEKNKNERMIEIMKSFENSKENIKEVTEDFDGGKLLKEQKRIKDLASGTLNADFKNENYYVAGGFNTGGQGKTVNSFLNTYQDTNSIKSPKSEPSSLKPEEALEVSIKRTLKSGTPINNISFYDEVNWNLMNLGFPAVNAIKIKETIFELIGE